MPGSRFKINIQVKNKVLNMTLAHHQMRLAVKADLDNLFKRLPDPRILAVQLREMIRAEKRAEEYGLTPPWREKDWYGIEVPITSDEVTDTAILTTRTTGKRAGRQKENRK